MSTDVEDYINKQGSPQKEMVQMLRATILKTLPNIKEELRMGVPWYEGKFYVVALKDHVNLGVSVNGLSEQEMALFQGKGKLMRHIKFHSTNDIDNDRVTELLQLIAEKSTCQPCGKKMA